MSKLWEVDPETRAKLLDIQKQNGNNICVDCSAPSPQWASPKFGVFMCLNCSGIHRGLGVHITFIRSVTMDGFKVSEVKRMQLGGNKSWQDFFDKHKDNQLEGKTFEDATIKERYDSDVGEEWKERLSAKVEGREYVPGVKSATTSAAGSRSHTPGPKAMDGIGSMPARSGSPAVGRGLASTQKIQNEAYFAKMGQENASRPDGLPPSQGGKFSGFGSEPASSSQGQNDADWLAGFGKDPMAGLTKGFGWLGKNVQKLAESDLAAQARQAAAVAAANLQNTGKTATESFSRFVEGESSGARGGAGPGAEKRDFWESFGQAPKGPAGDKQEFWDSFGEAPKGPSRDKQDFWDAFGDAGTQKASVGTSAMKTRQTGKKDDEWNEW